DRVVQDDQRSGSRQPPELDPIQPIAVDDQDAPRWRGRVEVPGQPPRTVALQGSIRPEGTTRDGDVPACERRGDSGRAAEVTEARVGKSIGQDAHRYLALRGLAHGSELSRLPGGPGSTPGPPSNVWRWSSRGRPCL